MGIKDNFSQAVKELWKKDGQDQGTADSQPSELEQYLRQQNAQQQEQAPAQSASQQPTQATPLPNDEVNAEGVPLETPYFRNVSSQPNASAGQPAQNAQQPAQAPTGNNPASMGAPESTGMNMNAQNARAARDPSAAAPMGGYAQSPAPSGYPAGSQGGFGGQGGYGGGYNAGGGYGNYPPSSGGNAPMAPSSSGETDETTIISKNTIIDGNIHSLANMQIDGNIKGNIETTRNIDMSGKVVGDITCNNAGMNSAAMQGNVTLKGRLRMDRDTILIGDLTSQYADINGRVRGKLEIAGKAELKRDAIVFGDISASTIAVTDGAIIQGYVNTTFLSKEDSRNVFPDAITLEDGTKTAKN